MPTAVLSRREAELIDKIKAALGEAAKIAEKATSDNGRNFTDEERAQVTLHFEAAKTAKEALSLLRADAQTMQDITDLGEGLGFEPGDPKEKSDERFSAAGANGFRKVGGKSLGTLFSESDAYTGLMKTAPNGHFGEKQRVQSSPAGFETLLYDRTGQKALVTGASDTSGGQFVEPQHLGLVSGPEMFMRPLSLRDVVTGGQTTTDTIDFVKITGFSNNASVVAEATTANAIGSGDPAVTAAQAGLKPESGFSTARDQTTVKTIAHWIPVTKRALSDAAQVRTLIDAFLMYGLEEVLEEEMLTGDGTGEHFLGLENVSGTQSQAAVADPAGKPAGFGMMLALRRAKTKVRMFGRATANAYVMHPLDLEKLDEISDNDGRFYFGGPSGSNGTAPLWGLPIIENETITQGTAWCGDWRRAVLYDREQANITVSDSHENFFVRNLVAILAEMRAAFAVLQPSAFVEVDLTV